MTEKFQPRIVFDFDGVINSYKSGWTGVDVIPDAPVKGIKEVLDDLKEKGYYITIVSSRCVEPVGVKAILNWLEKYDITVNEVRADKPPAKVYVDDRALTFNGDTSNLVEDIINFRPWTERNKKYTVPLAYVGGVNKNNFEITKECMSNAIDKYFKNQKSGIIIYNDSKLVLRESTADMLGYINSKEDFNLNSKTVDITLTDIGFKFFKKYKDDICIGICYNANLDIDSYIGDDGILHVTNATIDSAYFMPLKDTNR